MVMANTERIAKALDLLRDGLAPKCEETWQAFYGDDWLQRVNRQLHKPDRKPNPRDIAFVFKGIKVTWNEVFGHGFAPAIRSLVFEVAEVRNTWAHQGSFSSDDTARALDAMERVLEAFGDSDSRQSIKALRHDLRRQVVEEEARSERRKTAARPTEGQPQAGLTPWREIIAPHADVASGQFEQAEFAADLFEVFSGRADTEYQDPKAFFARTYLTEGLRDLLVGATRRLCGEGGDPVVELQTNFGGGKTHSLIALYHLASDAPAEELAGIAEALTDEKLSLPSVVNRAVLVGQKISPATPERVEDGIELHTLWGRLAYQLGGKAGYELVRADDEAGTNPGAALRTLLQQFSPAVVLIDEWVAYARQLRDGDDGKRLAGGDFDTQFTFAQALTEAAASVPNVVVLVSIPASDIEVGGDRGKTALEKLKNVVTRLAAQWQPASPDESFEIVRRRLFEPMSADKARVRDGVIGAFSDMYRSLATDFPSECSETEYRRRMEASYPIHPELFDRLFNDWSTLDKFQRTRGVLRLMAEAISHLWQRGDQSLLIMPGNLPMDSGDLVSEMKKYLEEGWDPVIKSDVDGANSLPLRIDGERSHFGKLSAARRAARTVYMGSAAKPDRARGVDVKRIMLGCVQPGEEVNQFDAALKELSGRATHLYVDGAQYWYGLQPTVTRLAADRAASNYDDRDADEEVRKRILAQAADRAKFSAVQIFAEGPGDVPDDDDGVRLVILAPDATHSINDANSPGMQLAKEILSQRHGGPRLNRNLLVFVAAEARRMPELRGAARLYLAWQSIVEEHETLDLTAHQYKQAQTQLNDTSKQVRNMIGESFIHVLTPRQARGTSEIEWQSSSAGVMDEVIAKVSKKMVSEDWLIEGLSGLWLRIDLDRFDLWSERGDISVGELWSRFARYPYMHRLGSLTVLTDAISNGTSQLNWEQETFGYAEAHDGETWVGVRTGEHVVPSLSGFLIRPDFLPDSSDGDEADAPSVAGSGDGSGGDGAAVAAAAPGSSPVTGYYAHFGLDPVRWIKQVGAISEDLLKHLGPDLELSLEIRAGNDDGYDDNTRRIVEENARNLGAQASEFD